MIPFQFGSERADAISRNASMTLLALWKAEFAADPKEHVHALWSASLLAMQNGMSQ